MTFEKNQGSGTAKNILFANTHEYPRYKRLMSPAFSKQAIKEQKRTIQDLTDVMIDALRTQRDTITAAI